jgi:hypothetical protein
MADDLQKTKNPHSTPQQQKGFTMENKDVSLAMR